MKLPDMKIMLKKTFIRKKINCHDPGGHERCKDSITVKKAKGFVRVGEELKEFRLVVNICLIYRISSVNGSTLRILCCSILVPR
jgi:hypothetical protein